MKHWRRNAVLTITGTLVVAYFAGPILIQTPQYATIPTYGPYNVVTVGGSVSYGWGDPKGGGYLKRAFRSMSTAEGMPYTIIAQEWMPTFTNYAAHLTQIRPNMVVLAYGLLDDLKAKTTITELRLRIYREIKAALQAGSAVLLTTPVITKATYTEYAGIENRYAQAEIQTARSFHNPHVYVFDLLTQMEAYLKTHHQTYIPYMHDGWHPNAAGHALAARILTADMERSFRRISLWMAIRRNLSWVKKL